MRLLLRLKDVVEGLMVWTSKVAGLREIRGHHFIECLLKPDGVVLDLGSNNGEFAAEISEGRGCRVFGVEAEPTTFARLRDTRQVHFLNFAIASADMPITLHLSNNPEGNSINLNIADGEMGWQGKSATVLGTTIPSLLRKLELQHVDLVKMDVEGAEVEAIDATSDEQVRLFDQLTVEFHDSFDARYAPAVKRVKGRLRALGFVCLQMSAPSNMDVLFVQRSVFSKLSIGRICALVMMKSFFLPVKHAWGRHLEKTKLSS